MKVFYAFAIALLLGLAVAGCGINKDAEVNAFTAQLDKVTNDIAAKINADSSEKGVDEAVKAFEAGKADLQTKWDAIKEARDLQVSAEVKKKMEDAMNKDVATLTALGDKIQDPAALQKYGKMLVDFGNMFAEKK